MPKFMHRDQRGRVVAFGPAPTPWPMPTRVAVVWLLHTAVPVALGLQFAPHLVPADPLWLHLVLTACFAWGLGIIAHLTFRAVIKRPDEYKGNRESGSALVAERE